MVMVGYTLDRNKRVQLSVIGLASPGWTLDAPSSLELKETLNPLNLSRLFQLH